MRRALFLWCLLAFGVVSPAAAAPLPGGRGRVEVPYRGGTLVLHTYKPAHYTDGPLVVVFHGIVRNADQYRDFAVPVAERFGAIVAAPELDEARFPEEWYQRGGVLDEAGKARPRDAWFFDVVPAIVAGVRASEAKPELRYFLLGHSAGAQCLVRLAAFVPVEAQRIIAGNAGSLLFPNTDHAFGYGLGDLPPELRDDVFLRRYLAAPLTLYLGTADVTPRKRFDASEAAMKQGPHRFARNRNAFAAAQALARERGWDFKWRIVEVPGVEHDAAKMFAAPELAAAFEAKP
jgi:poly(3-hydroxybutyrate) depolymerase